MRLLALSCVGLLAACSSSSSSSTNPEPDTGLVVDARSGDSDNLADTTGEEAELADTAVADDTGNSADSAAADTNHGPETAGRVPKVHRPTPVACPTGRGAGDADPEITSAPCTTDAQCTAGKNGRCLVSSFGAHTNFCSYDTCGADTDCTKGQVCACRDSATSFEPNACTQGNCVVDADCGPNGYCSPSVAPDKTNDGVVGWFCHTGGDTCLDDSDCASMSPPGKCAFDSTKSSWSCSNTQFLPP